MKSHYEALDGLRGTAAFSVFLFHICEMLVVDLDHNPMPHTFLAVDFFFALSGFVLGHAYDASMSVAGPSKGNALSLGGFLKRRLIRLHPMVVIAMIVAVATYLLDPFVSDAPRINIQFSWLSFGAVFALSLLLLPTPALPDTFGETHSLNGPAWYGLPVNEDSITLVRRAEAVTFPAKIETGAGPVTVFDPMFPLHWDVEI